MHQSPPIQVQCASRIATLLYWFLAWLWNTRTCQPVSDPMPLHLSKLSVHCSLLLLIINHTVSSSSSCDDIRNVIVIICYDLSSYPFFLVGSGRSFSRNLPRFRPATCVPWRRPPRRWQNRSPGNRRSLGHVWVPIGARCIISYIKIQRAGTIGTIYNQLRMQHDIPQTVGITISGRTMTLWVVTYIYDSVKQLDMGSSRKVERYTNITTWK